TPVMYHLADNLGPQIGQIGAAVNTINAPHGEAAHHPSGFAFLLFLCHFPNSQTRTLWRIPQGFVFRTLAPGNPRGFFNQRDDLPRSEDGLRRWITGNTERPVVMSAFGPVDIA